MSNGVSQLLLPMVSVARCLSNDQKKMAATQESRKTGHVAFNAPCDANPWLNARSDQPFLTEIELLKLLIEMPAGRITVFSNSRSRLTSARFLEATGPAQWSRQRSPVINCARQVVSQKYDNVQLSVANREMSKINAVTRRALGTRMLHMTKVVFALSHVLTGYRLTQRVESH